MVKGVRNPVIRISEVANLDVINLADGSIMGLIDDLEMDLKSGKVTAVVIPDDSGFWGFISGGSERVVPWKNIVKIGEDVILVDHSQGGKMGAKRE